MTMPDVTDCVVCFSSYSEVGHDRIIFECTHELCVSCVTDVVKKGNYLFTVVAHTPIHEVDVQFDGALTPAALVFFHTRARYVAIAGCPVCRLPIRFAQNYDVQGNVAIQAAGKAPLQLNIDYEWTSARPLAAVGAIYGREEFDVYGELVTNNPQVHATANAMYLLPGHLTVDDLGRPYPTDNANVFARVSGDKVPKARKLNASSGDEPTVAPPNWRQLSTIVHTVRQYGLAMADGTLDAQQAAGFQAYLTRAVARMHEVVGAGVPPLLSRAEDGARALAQLASFLDVLVNHVGNPVNAASFAGLDSMEWQGISDAATNLTAAYSDY